MSASNQNTQPVITTEEPFIVRVKLLSNEVYDIPTSPNTSITEFKKLVHAKTQVPIERQRLVFSGKQLTDGTNVGDYVKESGLTIHLIARSQPPPENTSNSQQGQQQQQPQPPQPPQQQVPPQFRSAQLPFPPPFGLFGMINPQQTNQNAQQEQQPPNPFAQNINLAVNTLMGNLGIRLVPPPPPSTQPQQNTQTNTPHQQPAVQRPTQQQPQSQQPQPQYRFPNQPNPNPPFESPLYRPIEQLETSLNRINLPPEQIYPNPHPRLNTINYLRRLQNDILRFIPQLNRAIQLLQEGRTTHLPDFIEIFESLSESNANAAQLIRNISQSEPQQQPHHHHHHHAQNHSHTHPHQHPHPHPHPRPQPPQPPSQQQGNNTQMEVQGPEITATIVISDDQNGGQINVDITNSTNQQAPQFQNSILNSLNTFLQPGSGSNFNFANLFASPQPPQIPQPPQVAQNSSQRPPQQTVNQPQSRLNSQDTNSRPQQPQESQPQPQPQPQSQPQPQPQQQQQAQNPLGGMNIMSIFNNLQQSGGMGALMGMSLGAMLEEEGQPTTIYSAILSPITGNEVLACFMQKDFSFISKKRQQFREATLKAISVVGNREDLVNSYSKDLEKMLIPERSVKNEEICRKRVSKILHRHIEKVVGLFLDGSPELALTDLVMTELKEMYCEAIEEISKHSEGIESVFNNIKQGFIQSFEQLIPGFAGLLYTIIERDLVRVYREYTAEKKRKQEMSAEQAQDEADLLKRIEAEAKEDAEIMAAFEHSEFYPH